MMLVCLIGALALVGLKTAACLWGFANQVWTGGELAASLRAGNANDEAVNAWACRANPVDRAIARIQPCNVRKTVAACFRSWITVSVGVVAVFVASATASPDTSVEVVLALTVAAEAVIHVATALMRRLVIGHHDSRAADVQILSGGPFKNWEIAQDYFANLTIYFLVLVYLVVVSFAALYAALAANQSAAFAHAGVAVSSLTWLYFSITTSATLGTGDVHPRSTLAQLAVTSQIVCGPVLLSWLITAFATRPAKLATARQETVRAEAVDGDHD
jgi:hypothetical protein